MFSGAASRSALTSLTFRRALGALTSLRGLGALTFALLSLVALPARAAWYETHVSSDQVRLVLEPGGRASVEHALTFHVAGGPMPFLDVRGVDADAQPELEAYALPKRSAEQGTLADLVPAQAETVPFPDPPPGEPKPLPTLRLRFAEKGLTKGTWVAHFRYRTELVGRGLLAREGSLALLRWTGPVFEDGLDGARLLLQLPDAPTEPSLNELPQTDAAEGQTPAPSVVSTLRRTPGRDELELVRPYVPKLEVPVWNVRLDARAVFPLEVSAPPAPESVVSVAQVGRARPALVLAGAALLFALYTGLAIWKAREVARAAAQAGVSPRLLLPLPLAVRAPLGALVLVGGVAAQVLLSSSLPGACLVLLAALFLVHLTPTPARERRGPGRWLAIKETEVFQASDLPASRDYLDASTRDGQLLFAASLLLLAALVWALSRSSSYQAWLAALDGVVLLALFGTGRQAELLRSPLQVASPLLARVVRRLRAVPGQEAPKVVPRLRIPRGEAKADELRLLVVPRAPVEGLLGIEVGVLPVSGPGRVFALPEVLVRFEEGSACAARVEQLGAQAKVVRGRRAGEQVVCLSPRLPTAKVTSSLVLGLVARLGAEPPEPGILGSVT